MSVQLIRSYEKIRDKFGSKEAEAISGFVETSIQQAREADQKTASVFREQDLKTMASRESLKDMQLELNNSISQFSEKIATNKTDIIRWMFAFFITLMITFVSFAVRK